MSKLPSLLFALSALLILSSNAYALVEVPVETVPEPATGLLIASGLGAGWLVRRLRQNRK